MLFVTTVKVATMKLRNFEIWQFSSKIYQRCNTLFLAEYFQSASNFLIYATQKIAIFCTSETEAINFLTPIISFCNNYLFETFPQANYNNRLKVTQQMERQQISRKFD